MQTKLHWDQVDLQRLQSKLRRDTNTILIHSDTIWYVVCHRMPPGMLTETFEWPGNDQYVSKVLRKKGRDRDTGTKSATCSDRGWCNQGTRQRRVPKPASNSFTSSNLSNSLYELQPKFRLMESSIRDIFIFWKLSWGLENEKNTLQKTITFALYTKTWKTIIHSSKIDDLELYTKYWPWPSVAHIYIKSIYYLYIVYMIVYRYVCVHAFMLVCMNMFKYNLCVCRTSLSLYMLYVVCK